jgi:hypothetical protein
MTAGDVVVWRGDAGDAVAWSTAAAPGSRSALAAEPGPGGARLRFDFALDGPAAWAIARRALAAVLPAHWVLSLRLHGVAPANELQVKLVDPGGTNVWWWRRRDFLLPAAPATLVLRRAALELAWGPASGADPDRIGAVEVAVAAGQGGAGTLWIDDLRLLAREPAPGPPHACAVRASSAAPGHEAAAALDPGGVAGWRPAPDDPRPWLEIDLGRVREWGGVVADLPDDVPACRLVASDDGERWTSLAAQPPGAGGRRWLRADDAESRFVRLELAGAAGARVARLDVVPIELALAPRRWARTAAAAAPRGHFPRHLLGEQAPWAVVGADGDARKGLLGADGALEVGVERYTLEPFVWTGERLVTWADVESRPALVDGCLPVPSVAWRGAGVCLDVAAVAVGEPGRSALVARYALSTSDGAARRLRLAVAIRPFQVTPAWQSLGLAGAVAPIVGLARTDARIAVAGGPDVVAVTRPDGFIAATARDGLDALRGAGGVATVADPLGFAWGALTFDLDVPADGVASVVVAVPLAPDTPAIPAGLERGAAAAWGAARVADATRRWRARLADVPIALPASGAAFAESLRASLAWMLVERDGPRLQPGPRAYRRAWIRDGAFMATALAEMGFGDEARAFLRWYAPYQLADGRVPCAVDARGVDPTVEHDSHGELAWAIVEVFRLTGDRGFLRALWPHVRRAAEAIAALRATRTGPAFRDSASFGLLPESISHEGYASRPVHAYWDDFFALCGLGAAAEAAAVLGDAAAATAIAAERDALRAAVHASIARTRATHAVRYLPGSVELGDLDPSSSAIALDPGGEARRLDAAAVAETFGRYWSEFDARRRGVGGEAYSPYEVRIATALLVLGDRERALAVLDWLVGDQRPPAWRQWPEVAHRDARVPRFLGDLPHGWVAACFVRAIRRLVAREDDEAGILVLGEGVRESWVREPPGVRVRRLPTHFGALDLAMHAVADGAVHVELGGDIRPPGGVVVVSPLAAPLREVVVDGRAGPPTDAGRLALRTPPRMVVLRASR